jgi:endonuclease-3
MSGHLVIIMPAKVMRASKPTLDIDGFLRRVRSEIRRYVVPSVTQFSRQHDPFIVLVSCLISLRTKDAVTMAASRRLFAAARTPRAMLRLRAARIARLIYPAGFYRTKARTIRAVSRALIERHGGKVPSDLDALLELDGVGRKTANLVVTLGFGKPGICVDTHVHRITNRWGYVRTREPDETELALRRRLPRRWWLVVNDLLVTFGQNVCLPVSPRCSCCPLEGLCPRRGVEQSR